MELTEIMQVQEIITQSYTETASQNAVKKVNELLNSGWVIIKTYLTCYDEEVFPNQQTMHYVLGLPRSAKKD